MLYSYTARGNAGCLKCMLAHVVEQVEGMAEYLGVQADDPPEVQEVAQLALVAPAPPGWEHVVDDEGDLIFQ